MTRDELLPKELLEKIPLLYSTEDIPLNDTLIKLKYFLSSFTWLVAECEVQEDNDVLFFGYVFNHADPDCSEWGYFTLGQLMEIRLFESLGVERDLWFKECKFSECIRKGC